jgi:hypothetical protein
MSSFFVGKSLGWSGGERGRKGGVIPEIRDHLILAVGQLKRFGNRLPC